MLRYLVTAISIFIMFSSVPVKAQNDTILGSWMQPAKGTALGSPFFGFIEDSRERSDGPSLVDYLGIPLTEDGLAKALSYDSSILSVPEHTCMRHPTPYSFWGPAQPKITAQFDEDHYLVAIIVGGTFREADRVIWMDGRPHPSKYAPHTWAGFTTGHWENEILVTKTTHLKWAWVRRNGAVTSPDAEVTTYYQRNGDILTITWFVEDPTYLSEPYIKSADFIVAPDYLMSQYGVANADRGGISADGTSRVNPFFEQCFPRSEVGINDRHFVPHFMPGENPFIREYADQIGVPPEVILGGEETAYPQFRERLPR